MIKVPRSRVCKVRRGEREKVIREESVSGPLFFQCYSGVKMSQYLVGVGARMRLTKSNETTLATVKRRSRSIISPGFFRDTEPFLPRHQFQAHRECRFPLVL